MSNLKSISIPEPCRQSWQQMTPQNDGRHCAQCSKVVADFTAMSNSQIIEYLSNNSHVCGRIQPHQMSSINSQLLVIDKPVACRLRGWAAAAALFFSMASLKTTAQTGAPIAQAAADSPRVKYDEPTMGKIAAPQYHRVTGQVIYNEDNTKVAGATVSAGGNLAATTDVAGRFVLNLPVSVTKITVSMVGCRPQAITIDPKIDVYPVRMYDSEVLLGDVVMITKRPPFFKRVYYKFIKRPVHKIFAAKAN